jgi:hypothetical protein
MASSKINIHAPGFAFPGTMYKYIWQFPELAISKKNGDRKIFTTFYVGLVNTNIDKNIVSKYMNIKSNGIDNPNYNSAFSWNNFCLELQKDYLDHRHLGNMRAFYVTDSHHEGSPISFKEMTFVNLGKNLKRANRTNVFTQALRDVLGKYNKKLSEFTNKKNNIILPMLAEGEAQSGNEETIKAHIANQLLGYTSSGLFCQPKYDGVRVLSTLNPKYFQSLINLPFDSDERVVCYSREGKGLIIPQHLLVELETILVAMMEKLNTTILLLDGEFYNHGMPFQEINGYSRGATDSSAKNTIDLIIYDYYDGLGQHYRERNETLKHFAYLFNHEKNVDLILELAVTAEDTSNFGHVKVSETSQLFATNDIYEYYLDKINNNYEGIMLRLPDYPYERSTRSKGLIKVKPKMSYEYKCVGYKFGEGKSSDIPIIQCKIGKKGVRIAREWWIKREGAIKFNNSQGEGTFYATLTGLTLEKQRELGASFMAIEANGKTCFENKYLDKKAIIEFIDFSKDLKPEKPNCRGWK